MADTSRRKSREQTDPGRKDKSRGGERKLPVAGTANTERSRQRGATKLHRGKLQRGEEA